MIKKILFFVFFISFLQCNASVYENPQMVDVYTKGEVPQTIANALTKYDDVSNMSRNVEKIIKNGLKVAGIPENLIAATAITSKIIANKQITTKIVNFSWRPVKMLTVRPDITYSLTPNDIQYALNVGLRF